MKKQIKKLRIGKKTISNLDLSIMDKQVGGNRASDYCTISKHGCGGGNTKNGNTCPGHKTCYNC